MISLLGSLFQMASRPLAASAGLIWLFVLSTAPAHAQGPPINTRDAFVTGLNGAAFRTFFLGFDRSDLRVDGEQMPDPLSRQVRVRGQIFVLPYEVVSNRLVVMAAVPYLDKSLETGSPASRQELSANGLGDLAFAAKVNVFQRDRPDQTTRAALFGRLKLPTAPDDELGPDGAPLPRPLQLGTGSVDYSAGISLTHSVGPLGLSGALTHDFNTASDEFAFSDVFHFDVALGYRVMPRIYDTFPAKQINVYVEANGTVSGRSTQSGGAVADSGGNVLWLSPGVQFIPTGGFLIEATYQIPVRQDLNGTQLEFKPTFKAGIRWLLF